MLGILFSNTKKRWRNDSECLSRALLIGAYVAMKNRTSYAIKKMAQNNQTLVTEISMLKATCDIDISVNDGSVYAIKAYQKGLENILGEQFQIILVSGDRMNGEEFITYMSPSSELKIHLLLHKEHYDVIKVFLHF